jgi:AcrR family transcriptional regulator
VTEPPRAPSERRRPGRPRLLTREAILDAARPLDREALTMTGLASQLGVSHAALYNYFAGKGALIAALAAEESAQIDLPSSEGRRWQDWLVDYAFLLRDSLLKYGVATEWQPTAFVGASIRITDAFLRVVLDAGFDVETAHHALRIIGSCCAASASRMQRRARFDEPSEAELQRDYYDSVGLAADSPLRQHVAMLLNQDEEALFRRDLEIVIASVAYNLERS